MTTHTFRFCYIIHEVIDLPRPDKKLNQDEANAAPAI